MSQGVQVCDIREKTTNLNTVVMYGMFVRSLMPYYNITLQMQLELPYIDEARH